MMRIRETAFRANGEPAEREDDGGECDGEDLQVGVHAHCIRTARVACDQDSEGDDEEEGYDCDDAMAFDDLVVLR